MRRVSRAIAAIAVVLSLTTGATALLAADQKSDEKVVATVNGQSITQRDLDTFAEQRSGGHGGSSSADQKTLLNELVTRELLYQKAVDSGFDKDPNIEAAIKQETHNLLANVVIQQLIQGRQPSENELKAAYRKRSQDHGQHRVPRQPYPGQDQGRGRKGDSRNSTGVRTSPSWPGRSRRAPRASQAATWGGSRPTTWSSPSPRRQPS